MEDYYRLIGVSADAEREEMREAYRARKAELDAAGTDESRAEASRLNRAWNVLSDELQRTKYDDQLAEAKAEGTVDDADDTPVVTPSLLRGRAGRGGRERPARQPRQAIVQETEINGVALASNKDRGIAMAIDLLIVFLLVFIGTPAAMAQMVGDSHRTDYCRTEYPSKDAIECQNELRDAATDQGEVRDDAGDNLDDAETALADAKEAGENTAKIDELTLARDDALAIRDREQREYDAIIDDFDDVSAKIQPLQISIVGGAFGLAFLVLFVPSALVGKTPGKAMRRIRLRRESGEPAGPAASLIRYGAVLGTSALGLLMLGPLGQFVPLVWLFGVTSFARNPRRQGWHDRLAKTIVAAD